MSKLKNIKALNQMLEGSHRTQTRKSFGFSDVGSTAEKNKKREIGEIWEEQDINGSTIYWEQKQGFRVKSSVHPLVKQEMDKIQEYLRSFPNCQKEVCTCITPTSLDHKFRKMVGMCEDCLISMETKLKIQGKFNEYALDKMKANAESFFKQADKEVELLKEAMKDLSFVNNEHGDLETWKDDGALQNYLEKIDENYIDFKNKTMGKFNANETND